MLIVADYLVVVLALLTAYYFRDSFLRTLFPGLSPLTVPSKYVYIIIPLIYLGLFLYERLYTKRLPFWQSAELVFKVSLFTMAITTGLLYFSGTAKEISRIFIISSWVFSYLYIVSERYLLKRLLVHIGLWQKPVVVIGAGKTAELISQVYADEPGMGYKIVGLIEDNFKERPLIGKYSLLGNFNNVEEALLKSGVKDVIIAAPGLERGKMVELVYRIQPLIKNITIVPDLFGVPMANIEVEAFFNQKAIMFKIRNNMARGYNRFLKRTFDLTGSLIGGLLILPVVLVIAVRIYLDSPGPIIFAHNRIGFKGKVFPCYKFRSMVPNAQEVLDKYLQENLSAREEWERDFKLKDDIRITKIGNFLRKTSLDELPQLLNVIKGEMSLVGPRPIVKEEIEKYGQYINDYYLIRPGMTGFWQVSGRNDVDYNSRVQMDSWYVRNWSLWQDIVLLFKTIVVVIKGKGAY
ncbi:undecaprenyl-phosphate galactose phosphotransferase WbaP|nr:undecaprenyl-phosphate galactose phosphotransferase WbaP [Dendrosporobacter quercicolus]NSL49169.1 undecaprenyl-phosphate galactose phosphotransferase WbaP [Dendrosporobacter quercicolus DSM 1736]